MKIDKNIVKKNSNWNFKGNVSRYFDEHIKRSIPFYLESQDLYLQYTDFFLQERSNIIDLGSSTGSFLNKIYERHKNNQKKLKFIGIDNTKEMINFCKNKYKNKKKIKFYFNDIEKADLRSACIIISFYTIQFISPKKRQNIIDKIYKNLNWGGAFFFMEKVRSSDARFQDMSTQIYNEFKLSNKFTGDQIISKSRSLKGILEPFSTNANLYLLKRAGFQDICSIFKFGCFEGFLAIK